MLIVNWCVKYMLMLFINNKCCLFNYYIIIIFIIINKIYEKKKKKEIEELEKEPAEATKRKSMRRWRTRSRWCRLVKQEPESMAMKIDGKCWKQLEDCKLQNLWQWKKKTPCMKQSIFFLMKLSPPTCLTLKP